MIMKKIILFAILSFMGLFAHAQTQIPYPAFTTNVDNIINVGGGLYDLTVSVTDQSGKYTGTAIDTVDFVFWQNCRRYTIDSVLVKFSSQAIVRVNDNDGSGAPIAGEAVIMKESPSGIGHFVSGILASRNQCIASYYTALIGTGSGGQDTFYLADGTIIVSGDTLPQMACSDERLSAPFLSTDRALLSAVDAENADVVFLFINGLFYDDTEYAVSGDTLIFNDYSLANTDTILVRACQNAVGSNFAATLNDVLSNGNNAGGLKIENIGAPTNNADAATKEYVDNNDDNGLISTLPNSSVTINADSNSLIINNLGVVAFQNLNALTEVQSGIASSAFSTIPTQMFRYEGLDTVWVRMTAGILQLRDKTGSYVLDDIASPSIPADSITITDTANNFSSSAVEGALAELATEITTTDNKIRPTLVGGGTLNFPSTAAGQSSDLTLTVTGAEIGDAVSVAPPASIDANSMFTAWVSALNTVSIRFNNYSSGAIDPASGLYNVLVTKIVIVE